MLKLYPLAMLELREQFGGAYLQENLENQMIFGSYPKVITDTGFNTKAEYLALLRDSYLVERYLDLLEKTFVIVNVRGYSGNLRKEVTKTSRYYFYDNGVRNAVIGNFSLLSSRNDVGQLWENLMFIERLKKQEYRRILTNNYFWRTWDKKEIDLVEERDGKLYGYEFKWAPQSSQAPKDWLVNYPENQYQEVNKDNFAEFVS